METLQPKSDIFSLKGKSAFITGGASGIGLATARAWAKAGAYVTIADIQSVEDGEKLASQLNAQENGHVNYVLCDVTCWKSQVAAFKNAIAFSPTHTLDIVATFAGTAFAPGNELDHVLAFGEPNLEVDPPMPNCRNLEVNLTGVYFTSWLALYYFRLKPQPQRQSDRSISTGSNNGSSSIPLNDSAPKPTKSLIFVASIGAYMDSPKASTYPASKFGVRGLFRSTRSRTLDIGVRCNLLAPWFVDTPLIAPIKKLLASRGIDMDKALAFTSVDLCVAAANLCAVDEKMHGKFSSSIDPVERYLLCYVVEAGRFSQLLTHV